MDGDQMKLLQNGRLTIPLYHGTSSLFVDSILKHGLGAINPIETLRVLPFLRCAYEICMKLFRFDKDSLWLTKKPVVEKMINQEITKGGFNFRHGMTYLTPSRITAVRYAIANPFGSEALSTAVQLYSMIKDYDPRYSLDSEFRESPVLRVLDQKARPVLIEVFDSEVHVLKGEGGQNAKEIIKTLEENLAKLGDVHLETLAQQTNFDSAQPVRSNQLKPYEIIVIKEDPNFPEYELREI